MKRRIVTQSHVRHKGGLAKKLVLDDEENGFWERVKRHVQLTMPICKMLRRFDSSAPSTGKVYHSWFEVGEAIKEGDSLYTRLKLRRQA